MTVAQATVHPLFMVFTCGPTKLIVKARNGAKC